MMCVPGHSQQEIWGSSSAALEREVRPGKHGLHWALVLSAREQSLISLFTNLCMDLMTII